MRSFLAAVMLIPAPTNAADRFDLVCTTKSGETRYRVDLIRNEACNGSCERVWSMGPPSTGELKLIDKAPRAITDLDERATVSRITGEYQYSYTSPLIGSHSETGRCEVATFSGFPTPKF